MVALDAGAVREPPFTADYYLFDGNFGIIGIGNLTAGYPHLK
jgi:hypothetical protein